MHLCGNSNATVRVRSVATVGGGLAHADPNQDPPAALIALNARVVARTRNGQREIPVDELFTGYYETVLQPGELIGSRSRDSNIYFQRIRK